jgi:hypothetical protein
MTLDEIFRRIVRAHLLLIGTCIALPLLAVLVMQVPQHKAWVGTVRVQVGSAAPTSTTEADALSSRVLALATTPSIVADALRSAKLAGNPEAIAKHHVTSQRLGESPIVEISVDNADRALAARQAAALTDKVVTFMNQGNRQTFTAALREVKKQLASANAQRDNLARQLSSAGPARSAALQAELTSAQSTVDRLSASESSMMLAAANQDPVVAIDPQRPQLSRTPSTLIPRSALAILLGLLIGTAAAVALETMRPRVAGTRTVARLFNAPVLGSVSERMAALANAMTLAARRQGLETLVLLGVDPTDESIARRMLEELRSTGASVDLLTRSKVGGSTPAYDDAMVGGPTIPTQVRFSELVEIGPEEERTAGVVVVCSGAPLQRDLDVVDDIVRTMRWPVVGVLDSGHRRHRRAE